MMKPVKSVSAHQECLNEADNRQHQKGREAGPKAKVVIKSECPRSHRSETIPPESAESNRSDDAGKRRHHRHFYKPPVIYFVFMLFIVLQFLSLKCRAPAFPAVFAAALMRRQGDSESVRFLKQSV